MTTKVVEALQCTCEACGVVFVRPKAPKSCPGCKSKAWNKSGTHEPLKPVPLVVHQSEVVSKAVDLISTLRVSPPLPPLYQRPAHAISCRCGMCLLKR